MPNNVHTVLLLSDTTPRVRQFQVTPPWLRGALIAATLGLLALSYLLYQNATLRVDYAELHTLRKAVQAQGTLKGKLQALGHEMERLRAFDHRVRLLAGMEKGTQTAVAVGGGTRQLERVSIEGVSGETGLLLERMYEDLQRLEREVALREESLQTLTEYLTRQKDRLAATPSIWPTRGYVSSKFGPRKSPFTGRRQQHTGIDIAAALGTPIVAPADGVVTFAGRLAGHGRAIVVNHGFGFKTFYGHNKKNAVKKGDRVKRGQVIGYVGNSGYSTGSHLHYEVLVKGVPQDPLKYILDEQRRPNT
ncbi:MAG: M23 family metallopeptidase [Candidatus Methylomirabilales bacterium]